MSASPVFEAAFEIQERLVREGAEFCVIGGLAVQRWGEPRFTNDADLTLLTGFAEDERWADFLLANFKPRRENARQFALTHRVVLLEASNGTPLDVALGGLEFERRTVRRATEWVFAEGRRLRTCSAEDLIVHKAFASRDRDWLDVEGILMRQGRKLDTRQIFDELSPLAELKEDEMILPRLRALMQKRGVL